MQISQIRQLPNKAPVLEPISGVLTEVYPAETKSHPQYGDKVSQNAKLTQGNDFIYVEFSGFPQDMMAAKGQQVTLRSTQTQHGWNGVKVNRYNSQKLGKEVCNLRVTSSAQVTVGQPTYNTEGQQVQSDQTTQAYHTNQASQPTPARQAAPQGNTLIPGMTVGMAINNACELLKGKAEPGTAQFSEALHQVASDIIRVSEYLTGGNLAEHPRKRGGNIPVNQQPAQQVPTPYAQPTTQEVIQEDVPMDFEDSPF